MTKDNQHKPKKIALIAALDEQNGIGRDGGLLCHLPADLKHFKEVTTGSCIIMGRKTYESLPKGALPNRTNIVLTSGKPENYPGCMVARSIEEALSYCKEDETVYIIGGGQLYKTTLPLASTLYLTRLHHTFTDADTFFPEVDFSKWELVDKAKHEKDDRHRFDFTFLTFVKKNPRKQS